MTSWGGAEDEAESSISLSRSTSSGTVEHRFGSDSGRCLMAFGEFLEAGIHAVLIRHKLSSIKARLRNPAEIVAVANDPRICEHLLELSRRGLYSTKVKGKAWSLILLFMSKGETEGLSNGIVRWPEIEIKIFLQEAVKRMPHGWIFDPQSRSTVVSKRIGYKMHSQPQIEFRLAMGFLELLANLMRHGDYHTAGGISANNSSRQNCETASLTSFVSGSGKLIMCPLAFQRSASLHFGAHLLPVIVKSIVCGRLNTISTRLRVEVACYLPSKEMIDLFSELLLIYKLFSTNRTIYRQTRELLFIVISRNHAVALSRALASWSYEELSPLLTDFFPWMSPFVYAECRVDRRFPKAYRAYLASHPNTSHPILPFLHFLIQLARSSEHAACLLIDSGVFKTLKLMCIHDFPNPTPSVTSTTQRMARIASSDVYASLILLFTALSSFPRSSTRMMHDRTIPPWFLSIYYTLDFLGLPHDLLLQCAWKDLEKSAMKLVLVALEHVMKGEDVHQHAGSLPFVNIYRDILSVLRDPTSEPSMLYSAADTLLTCVELGGDFRQHLDSVLGEGRLEDTVAVIKVVYDILALFLLRVFPPHTNGTRLELRYVHNYLTALAHAYTLECRTFSPLVVELLGSQAVCDAAESLARSERAISIVFCHFDEDSEDDDSIMNI